MAEPFTWPIRVYYEDTDLSGVVYHARYLHWFERARSEWLRARGWSHRQLAEEFGAAFTVAGLSVQYRQPARIDEALLASVEILRLGHASLTFRQTIYRPEAPQTLLTTAEVRVACVDVRDFKPRQWPAGWLEN